jgi:soluble lytic murein transglycosylase-like protein
MAFRMKITKRKVYVILFFLFVNGVGIYANSKSTPYKNLFSKYGKQYKIDPRILSAIAKVESNYSRKKVVQTMG